MGIAFLAWVMAAVGLWPHYRTWGATVPEWSLAFPGDHAPRTPQFEILYAVTIDAPPEEVWPWLIQIGQDRAGFYSYDWLERLFGAEIRNVQEIRPEWQVRQVGDLVPATQRNYLGGLFGERPGWTVALVEPGHALVLAQWGALVAFQLPHFIMQSLMMLTIKALAEARTAS